MHAENIRALINVVIHGSSVCLLGAGRIRALVNFHVINNGLNAHDSAWWNVVVADWLKSSFGTGLVHFCAL